MMEILSLDSQDVEIGKKVPLRDILAQHRRRYLIRSSIGDIVLCRIKYLDMEATTIELMSEVEGYAEAIRCAGVLEEKMKYGDLSAEDIAELNRVGTLVKQHVKRYYLHCFVEPVLNHPDEFDAILGALNASERHILLAALSELTNPNPGNVSISGLVVADGAGVPVSEGLTLETMTAQEASVFTKKSETEQKNLKELFK